MIFSCLLTTALDIVIIADMATLMEQIDPQKLRLARTNAGFSRLQMADALGVGLKQVGHYESGYSTPPSESLIIWARQCGVSVESLYTRAAPGAFRTRKTSLA